MRHNFLLGVSDNPSHVHAPFCLPVERHYAVSASGCHEHGGHGYGTKFLLSVFLGLCSAVGLLRGMVTLFLSI